MSELTVGSLFSGIGGLELGLERAGMVVKWQVEIDEYCSRVLAKHWPDVVRHRDVRAVGAHNLAPVDLICGGFPCQDISNAGRKAGIGGERSGLWSEYLRVIGELRPRYVVVENVPALLGRGLDRVSGDLSAIGYDAEWDVIPASWFGAPHLRKRWFGIAYPQSDGRGPRSRFTSTAQWPNVAGSSSPASYTSSRRHGLPQAEIFTRRHGPQHCDWWAVEPDVVRMVHGVSNRVDRIRGLGNAVVPQLAEYIGRLIMAYDATTHKKEFS